MSELIEELEKEVRNQIIYVIGGGMSFNPKADYVKNIPKERTICLNSALSDFDECLACMFMDSSWYTNNKKLLSEGRQKYAIRVNLDKRRLSPQVNDNVIYLRNANISKCSFEPNYRLKPYDVSGNNIGVCAIDLLEQLGAKTIYLLGFDCSSNDDQKSHYHEKYNRVVKQKTYDDKMLPCFENLRSHLEKRKSQFKVINLSPVTNIKSIPRKSLKNFDFP